MQLSFFLQADEMQFLAVPVQVSTKRILKKKKAIFTPKYTFIPNKFVLQFHDLITRNKYKFVFIAFIILYRILNNTLP